MSEKKERRCWRCEGTGVVGDTLCGACLGTKIPPEPCPKCGSEKVKVRSDFFNDCWYCRDCEHCGPWIEIKAIDDQFKALKAWNEEARNAKTKGR